MEKHLFKVTGDDKIIKACEQLGQKVLQQVARPAAKRAAQRIEAVIRASAPVASGKLRKSIKVRTSKGPRAFKGRMVVAFAVITGQGKLTAKQKASGYKAPYYTYMQEKGYHVGKRIRQGQKVVGYKPHSGNLGMQGVKFMPGKHFIKRALKATEGPVMAQMLSEMYAGIDAIVARG